jgi:chemotaxis protein histidine kinase CheA
VDSILESLDVVNIWEHTVPTKFVKTVFIAVIRQQLDIYQAKALCDLYHANYDLVRSAWEVYTVQEDTTDLIDTLRRIVKDLTVDEDDDEEGEGQSNSKAAPAPAAAARAPASKPGAAPAAKASTNASAGSPAQSATTGATGASPATTAAQAAMDRKQEALAAVAQAKRDLLKHSLEMMVKQSILTGEAAANLFRRYLHGDNLAEAAIDAYASDRNVAEFLDTLQILANHTPAELNEMMKDVADEAAENATSPDATAVNTRANAAISPQTAGASPTHNAAAAPAQGKAVSRDVAAAQAQLKGIVAELARNHMITAEVHSILNRLVAEPDRRLIMAFERYQASQEGAKLIDTLLHVAAAEMALQQPLSSAERDGTTDEVSHFNTFVFAPRSYFAHNLIIIHLTHFDAQPVSQHHFTYKNNASLCKIVCR